MPQKRDLDGCYFRVQRDGRWQDICFSDLTAQERASVCQGKPAEWFESLAYHLADCLQAIGEEFNLQGD